MLELFRGHEKTCFLRQSLSAQTPSISVLADQPCCTHLPSLGQLQLTAQRILHRPAAMENLVFVDVNSASFPALPGSLGVRSCPAGLLLLLSWVRWRIPQATGVRPHEGDRDPDPVEQRGNSNAVFWEVLGRYHGDGFHTVKAHTASETNCRNQTPALRSPQNKGLVLLPIDPSCGRLGCKGDNEGGKGAEPEGRTVYGNEEVPC